MVVIEISKSDLLELVGRPLSDEEIIENLFLLKMEAEIKEDAIMCELSPDRPDMLSVEGIARELKGFLGIETGMKKYEVKKSGLTLKKENPRVRPYIACAIIKDVILSDALVRSLMQVQEKLHATIGRDRKKVAIGVHDFDKVVNPLLYTDVEDETFVPLNMSEKMTVKEILKKHPKGPAYAHLVKDLYPMLYDKEGVLSFPPIINSERTKVTENTKSLFIDVTGTDEKAVNLVLNILVCNITERCGKIFDVKISNSATPKLESKEMSISVNEINDLLGIGLDEKQIAKILERMRYSVKKQKGGNIVIDIPPYRSDILHKVDIIEDVAIGFGYNNIEPILPKISTIGEESELEKLTSKIRELMIGLGFQETLNFILTSKENNFEKMNLDGEAVEILNPTTSEYSITRTWLLPNMLRIFFLNKNREYPQKIFEVGDCLLLDDSEKSNRQERKLVGAITYDSANLTEIKSIVEAVLKSLGYEYEIQEYSHPSFIESRYGIILVDGKEIGMFGEISPKVLENWKIEKPVIAFEISVG